MQQPGVDGRGLVGGVVVRHQVGLEADRDFLVELDEELLELLGTVAAVRGTDHLADDDGP
ncbi:hypothetical protein [Streptomyces sp. NPDC093149]|uniref:hypothetical protein n=1 Tax=Streptomyces sp. NPDC093149 TaxID=3366031 RepID=UPI00380E6533